MQDKLLFAAGLVALLIGLFVGVRSDNLRKTAEENLANVTQQVESAQQQLKMAQDRNKVIADKLGGMEKKLDVAQDKLNIANDWYANLQKTNATLRDDIYTIRLAMVEVLADLKEPPSAAGQTSISHKIEKLVNMLDEHNATAGAGQQPSKEKAAVTPEQKAASKEKAKGAEGKLKSGTAPTEKVPAAAAPEKEKDMSSGSGQQGKAAPAEKTEKSEAGVPQTTAPAEKQPKAAPAPQKEENKEGAAVRL